ncbi:efflux RND transporter periplasmic adaptor subunit [Paraneptunicella aestuarii]|uniref:efflux RND transporter periplasmic adaptor subunit n=1 Tax=Paraneptunicella aestuarii TaxID=2831148 RepID=UPI001E28E455|nr:efflux RND transporter periplasmic adaptor subunit [Paraneptunicella aestuarii]UAA38629.1 efflux RND transporter periplasmic adaptor subunit [Paraneptunicella aestuarii]
MNRTHLIVAVLSAVVGSILTAAFYPSSNEHSVSKSDKAKQPLYWVAPMDPNYRRSEPGKSPMGMDLVPVYEEDSSSQQPGTVSISPNVVNNLGVRTSPVQFQPWEADINTVGYVKYNEDHLIHIHPRVSGWVESLNVKAAGEPVEQGQPLYSLYSPELVNAQEEYVLARKSGNQTLMQAALNRLVALQFPESVLTQLQKQGKVQQTVEFKAPQSGVVDALKIREGFYVKPGTTLMSIASLDEVWVEAEVFERQASDVYLGMPVSMTLDYLPGKQWQGHLDYIYPKLDEKLRTLRIRLRFANPEAQLKPNMYAQVTLHGTKPESVLQVAREAVIRTGTQDRVVLELASGQYKSVMVEIGRVSDRYIEILSGLNVDDRVVTSAQFLLDSESSISSDFVRMSHDEGMSSAMDAYEDTSSTISQATVNGLVNQIDTASRTVNISREAIEKWQRPAATMDFQVSEDVDLSEISAGTRVEFTFVIDAGDFIIIAIHPLVNGGQS